MAGSALCRVHAASVGPEVAFWPTRRDPAPAPTSLQALKKDWNFYFAYNMFRIAAILKGIAKRVEDGTASSAQAKASGAGARPMAELAWLFAQRH